MMNAMHNRFAYIKDKKGFTIIEVLMAMAIFAIGFLAIGKMLMYTTRNNTSGNFMTQATMIAREQMEYLKTLPIDDMSDQCLDENEPVVFFQNFKRECEVEPDFSSTARIIEVKVKYTRWGDAREVVLKTLTRGNGT